MSVLNYFLGNVVATIANQTDSGAQRPARYGRFADAPTECHKIFTERLGRTNVPISEDGWIPYCIPSIIKAYAGEDIK